MKKLTLSRHILSLSWVCKREWEQYGFEDGEIEVLLSSLIIVEELTNSFINSEKLAHDRNIY